VAVLAGNQVTYVMGDSRTDLMALYAIRNVNTGDTLDVSAQFTSAKLAVVLWTTTAKSDKLTAPVNNVVTLSTANLANDAGWLMVWGAGGV